MTDFVSLSYYVCQLQDGPTTGKVLTGKSIENCQVPKGGNHVNQVYLFLDQILPDFNHKKYILILF